MPATKIYGLDRIWDRDSYRALLEAAATRGGYCVLVQRRRASRACLDWIEKRAADLEAAGTTKRWPGTIVLDDDDAAILLKYRISPDMIRALASSADTPFGWIGPDLPEDLAFLRLDGRPWFVSIAHEGDAFFKLSSAEAATLRGEFAGADLAEQGEDQMPDDSY